MAVWQMEAEVLLLKRFVMVFAVLIMNGFVSADEHDQTTIQAVDLSGTWKVRVDPQDLGEEQAWYDHAAGTDIRIPGIVTEAGLGEPLALKPELTSEVLQHLHQHRSYIGAAWFTRQFKINNSKDFKNAVLSIERVLWTSEVWVNGNQVGLQDSLCVPHAFEVGPFLKDGDNLIAIRVDNRPHVDIGIFGHAYTQQTQTIWNGLLGKVMLTPVKEIDLRSFRVVPQLNPHGRIRTSVTIDNQSKRNLTQSVTIWLSELGQSTHLLKYVKEIETRPGRNVFDLNIPTEDVVLWSEFTPRRYRLTCEFAGAVRNQVTGFRKIEKNGRELLVNNRPVFMRGTLDCCIFPKTGYPPMDVNEWKRIFSTLKDYGINHVRFHSWCPPEAAFFAADELGLYLQPELPNWTSRMGLELKVDGFLMEEGERILETYGHHPSFVMFSLGNELRGDLDHLDSMISEFREKATHILYTSTSYSFSPRGASPGPQDDFFISQKTRTGWVRGQGFLNTTRPNTVSDYSLGLEAVDIPLITHEVGQYCVYPNLAELPKYDGNLRALNFEAIQQDLKTKGRLEESGDYTSRSGALAKLLYKEDIERALRTKGLAGIQLLGLQDFSGQSTATVGMLDAFWESKGIVDGLEFRQFCGPVVPLMRTEKLCWNNQEVFKATIEVANFGAEEIKDAVFKVAITDQTDEVVHTEEFARSIPFGNGTRVGNVTIPLNQLTRPTKLTMRVHIQNTDYCNSWTLWCYPDVPPARHDEVVVCHQTDKSFEEAVSQGKKILLLPDRKTIQNSLGARFVPVFWSPLHFPNQPGSLGAMIDSRHPVFERFPTDSHTDWQWWELLANSTSIDATELGPEFSPIMRFVDKYNRNALSACMWETKVGEAKVFVCTLDIESGLEERIVAKQLNVSVFSYLKSKQFSPSFSCDVKRFLELFKTPEAETIPARDN